MQRGGVIAYPTEAVFGLGCDPQQKNSIRNLLQIKQRPAEKGLILIASSVCQLLAYIDTASISEARWAEVQASWPGPVTWLLPYKKQVSKLIYGEHTSIAVRVSAHPAVVNICDTFGRAIISTSANRSGQPPLRSSEEVWTQLGGQVDFILEGGVGKAAGPSEIRDAVSGRIIRPAEQNETE